MRHAKPATFVFSAALVVIAVGCNTARPVSETGVNECERCHGFPPAATHVGISATQPSDCSPCHGTTVAADGTIIPGGVHMDGKPDFKHPSGFGAPTAHGYAADSAIASCTQCHGATYGGGTYAGRTAASCDLCHASDWRTNCTFCHGTRTSPYNPAADLPKAAPPQGVYGEMLTTDSAVGAHQKHVFGGGAGGLSDGVECSECHTVPSDFTHPDGTAKVSFGALATQGGLNPSFAAGTCTSTYCHGTTLNGGTKTTPSWTGSVACGDCHANPPLTGRHDYHVRQQGYACSRCHADVAAGSGVADSALARSLHVNGQKDVSFSSGGTWDPAAKTCSGVGCHGSRSW